MTETEWQKCVTRPDTVLACALGKISERKLRLFASAACRRYWDQLADARSRQAVIATEMLADGLISRDELERCHREASGVGLGAPWLAYVASNVEARAAALAVAGQGFFRVSRNRPMFTEPWPIFKRAICILLREIISNPFRPITINPAWLNWNDGTVRRIAQSIYDEKAFDRMPILADALQDAGCDNEDVLSHCRSDGPHVRGCWALDILLGKE